MEARVLVDRGFLGIGVSWREIGRPNQGEFLEKNRKKKKGKSWATPTKEWEALMTLNYYYFFK